MGEINPNVLAAARTAFSLKFQNAFSGVPTLYQKFCMLEGDAAHTAIEFPFLETFAFMREWIGPRQIKNLTSRKLRIVERPFEDTVKVKVRDLETDNWKQYATLFAQMGEAGGQLWDRLAVEAVTQAKAWIDNKAFFADTHKYGSSLIVNVASAKLSKTSFEAGYETMTSYRAHNGEALAVIPDTLMVGPKLRGMAWDLIKNTRIVTADGQTTTDNRNLDLVEIVMNPRLVGDFADDWYLMQANKPIKPVVLQKSKDAQLVARDKPDHDNVFERDEIVYGSKAYGNAACAFPHLIYRGGR